jgi:hypothetical protein
MRMRRFIVPVRLYNVSPQYLINGTIVGEKNIIELKMRVMVFSTTFV